MKFHAVVVGILSFAAIAAFAAPSRIAPELALEEELRAENVEVAEAVTLPERRAHLAAALSDRREIVRALVRANPRAVVEHALSDELRANLPSAIQGQVERTVSTVGDFYVYSEVPMAGSSRRETTHYEVVIDGQRYPAVVYGRRLNQGCKMGIPLQGVIVDGVFVLDENPIQILEKAPRGTVTDIESNIPTGKGVYARSGGVNYRFASRAHAEAAKNALINEEGHHGPTLRKHFRSLIEGEKATAMTPVAGSAGAAMAATTTSTHKPITAAAWTTGDVKILVVRAISADNPGNDPTNEAGSAPKLITKAWCDELMTSVASYFSTVSYGKTSLTTTVSTKAYRLSKAGSEYAKNASGYQTISDEALALAAADFDKSQYDRILVVFDMLSGVPGSQLVWGGMAQVGGKMLWINGEFDFRVLSHELGHTYGLRHAGRFHVDDGNPVSPHATLDEYGDEFDGMGANAFDNPTAEFNPLSKLLMGWLSDSQVKTVTSNGVYRVYNFNGSNASAASQTVALKLKKDASTDVWVALRGDFRQSKDFLPATNIASSAYVMLDRGNAVGSRTVALDLAPSTKEIWDAGLQVGQTFSDSAGGYSIRTVSLGGSGPNQYLDVEIAMSVGLTISTNPADATVTAGGTATFSVGVAGASLVTYQWQVSSDAGQSWVDVAGSAYSGQRNATLSVAGVTVANDGLRFRCVLTNASGSVTSSSATLRVTSQPTQPTQPTIVTQPSNVSTNGGSSASFSCAGSGSGAYQWWVSTDNGASWVALTDGGSYSGSKSSTLSVSASSTMNGYQYRCSFTNAQGTVTTVASVLTVASLPPQNGAVNHLGNLSTRCYVGTGDSIGIAGIMIVQRTTVLIRGIGPSLTSFGVSNALPKAGLRLYDSKGKVIGQNEGWKSDAGQVGALTDAMKRLGAFVFTSDYDSAMVVTLDPGAYTAHLYGIGGTSGNGMIEVYLDAATTPGVGDHFLNLSSRIYVGRGDSIGIAGLILLNPAKVLIRAVGPSLGEFGVSGVLRKPTLTLFDQAGKVVASNTGWKSTAASEAAVTHANSQTGGFPFTSEDDSALVVELPAGAFTAHVAGAGNTDGNAMLEIYLMK